MGDGEGLHLSKDRKVAPRGWQQTGGVRAGRWIPMIANSFGLPARRTCPGLTSFCADCYAVGSEQSKGVAGALERNHRMLLEAGSVGAMTMLLADMVGEFHRSATSTRRRSPLTAEEMVFRLHWSGDFFSVDYAWAWRATMLAFPDIQFWAYTRSFVAPVNVVPAFVGVPNVALYLSVDRDNVGAAEAVAGEHPWVSLAYCDVDFRSAREMAAPTGRPTPVVCPENVGRLELMEDGKGACITCGVCVTGRRDVMFTTSHQEAIGVPVSIGSPGGPCACGCGRRVPLAAGRGRPRLYFEKECRWKAARRRAASRP